MHPRQKIISEQQDLDSHNSLAKIRSKMSFVAGKEVVSAGGKSSHQNGNILFWGGSMGQGRVDPDLFHERF